MSYEKQYEQYKELKEQALAEPDSEPEEVVEQQAETSSWKRHPGTLKCARELMDEIMGGWARLHALANKSSDPEVRGCAARLQALMDMRDKVK